MILYAWDGIFFVTITTWAVHYVSPRDSTRVLILNHQYYILIVHHSTRNNFRYTLVTFKESTGFSNPASLKYFWIHRSVLFKNLTQSKYVC